jgi:ATP-binding cassette subfamily B protein
MLLLGLAEAGGLLHALLLYRQGVLDVGSVIAYFGLIQLFGFPTWTSMWAYSQISLGISGARRILELMNRENNLDQNVGGYSGPMRGEVEFREVTFAYDGGEPVLDHISFRVHPGQTVAIVGQTGSG